MADVEPDDPAPIEPAAPGGLFAPLRSDELRADELRRGFAEVARRVEQMSAMLDGIAAGIDAIPDPPPAPDLAPLEQALRQIRSLVEVVVDTMPSSVDGSGVDLADRIAEAAVARLDVDELARQVAERLRQHFEVVTEDEHDT